MRDLEPVQTPEAMQPLTFRGPRGAHVEVGLERTGPLNITSGGLRRPGPTIRFLYRSVGMFGPEATCVRSLLGGAGRVYQSGGMTSTAEQVVDSVAMFERRSARVTP